MSPGLTRIRRARCGVALRSWSRCPAAQVHDLRFEARHSKGLWREVFSQRIVVSRKAGGSYEDWIRKYDTLRWGDRSRIRKQIRTFQAQAAVLHPPSAFQLNRRSLKRGDRVGPCAVLSGLATSFWSRMQCSRKRLAVMLTCLADGIVESSCTTGGSGKGIAGALNEALALSDGEFVLSSWQRRQVGANRPLFPGSTPLTVIPRHASFILMKTRWTRRGSGSIPISNRIGTGSSYSGKTMFLTSAFFARTCLSLSAFVCKLGEACTFMIFSCVTAKGSNGGKSVTSQTCSIIVELSRGAFRRKRLVAGAIKAVEEHLKRQQVAAEVTCRSMTN